MDKRKVVLLISSSIGGGAQFLLLDLVKCLNNNFDILIICPKGFLADHLIQDGFNPYLIDINYKTIGKIRRIVLGWAGTDCFTINPMLFGTAYYVCKAFHNDKQCRIFSLLLNPIIRNDMTVLKKIAYKHIARVIGKYSHLIGVGSPELEKEVISLTKQKPIYLENRVPNNQSPRTHYYDGSRPLKVCFVGRMAEQKRPDLFVETARKTAEHNANIEYYMAGEGHLLNETRDYINENGLYDIVHLVGFQENLYAFLGTMDVLFLSSEFENTPLIMLNAMNASLPIVCGSVKGVVHLIDNQINGIIADEYSPDAFASILNELADNPSKVVQLSKAAYEKALGDLSYEKFVSSYIKAL